MLIIKQIKAILSWLKKMNITLWSGSMTTGTITEIVGVIPAWGGGRLKAYFSRLSAISGMRWLYA